jgi:hypothetical protein
VENSKLRSRSIERAKADSADSGVGFNLQRWDFTPIKNLTQECDGKVKLIGTLVASLLRSCKECTRTEVDLLADWA